MRVYSRSLTIELTSVLLISQEMYCWLNKLLCVVSRYAEDRLVRTMLCCETVWKSLMTD
jgi:hypothetical protein